MVEAGLVSEAKRIIDVLAASPRFAGSTEERKARTFCADLLKSAGLTTREVSFEFSQWPGRYGIPLIAGLLLFAIVVTALSTGRSANLGGLAWMFSFLLLSRILLTQRKGATRTMTSLRSPAVNLEATRGAEPRVWLVAHLDSKSQSIPMLVRIASYIALITVVIVCTGALFLTQWGVVTRAPWGWIMAAGLLAAIPSLFCLVGNKSPGALDNATGVAAVLLAARRVSQEKSFGVLITSAEELDLAGARAWAPPSPDGGLGLSPSKLMMINCDTVDDEGAFRCMYTNRPHKMGMAAEKAAKKLGLPLRMGKVIPGIITDSMAFEAAGLPSVTLSRGTVQTLARLHTSGDSPDRLTGSGAAVAAAMLAQMVEELT